MADLATLNAAIDNLATGVGTIGANVATLGTNITAELAAIAAAIGNAGTDPAALQAATDRIIALSGSVTTQAQAIADAATVISNETASLTPQPVATALAFTTQPPATAAVDTAFSATVEVQDAHGAVVPSNKDLVTLSLVGGDGTAVLGGNIVSTVAGIASFGSLTVDKAGTYTLSAADGSLAQATSTSFIIA